MVDHRRTDRGAVGDASATLRALGDCSCRLAGAVEAEDAVAARLRNDVAQPFAAHRAERRGAGRLFRDEGKIRIAKLFL